jgi:carboxyl-terminal processing protease
MQKRHWASVLTVVCLFCLLGGFSPVWALEETGGVGMTVGQLFDDGTQDHKGYVVVLDVFKDGPAQVGGVEPGDIVTHINGRATKGRELKEILQKEIRGAEGGEVNLKIWRYSQKKRLEIKLTRTPMIY